MMMKLAMSYRSGKTGRYKDGIGPAAQGFSVGRAGLQ